MVSDIQALVLQKYGLVAKQRGKDFHSACPACGGKDRMIWYADGKGNGFCRQCEKTFWLTDLEQLDPLEKLERIRIEKEVRAREAQIQMARLKTWQEKTAYRQGWKDALNYAAREWWHAQGITDASMERYELGASKFMMREEESGERREFMAYTIPIRDPETWELVNMQYRLANPPPGRGKYLQESGLPARSFYTRQHTGGDVIIVEGAKKAIVLNQLLEDSIQVVGLPGITPIERLIAELSSYKRKYFMPDPDVPNAPIRRFADRLTGLHVVRLPVKPDDAVVRYGFTRDALRTYCAGSRVLA